MVSLTLVYFSILPEPDDVSHSFGLLIAAASAPGRRVRVQVLVGRAAAVRRAVVAAACRADGRVGPEPRTGKLRSVGRWQLASQHD